MPTVFETQPQEQPEPEETHPNPEKSHKGIKNPHHDRMSLFTAFAEQPEGVTFETQHEGENVVIFMRQHFILNLPWVLAAFLLVLAPFVIIPFVLTFIPLTIFPPLPSQYYVVGLVFWYVMTFGYVLINFIKWYYNIYIVTTERIIDIDFLQLLYKKFSEARLTNIEDVTYTAPGFFATVFNYGDVLIQTAGETTNFEFHHIPRPADVVKTMGKLIREAGGGH